MLTPIQRSLPSLHHSDHRCVLARFPLVQPLLTRLLPPSPGINFTLLSLRLATITDSDAWGSRTTPHGAHSRSTVANVRFRTSDWRTHESGDWQSPEGVWQSPEGVWQTPDSWDTDRTRGAETELQVKTSGRELAGGLEFAPAPSTVKGSLLDDPASRID